MGAAAATTTATTTAQRSPAVVLQAKTIYENGSRTTATTNTDTKTNTNSNTKTNTPPKVPQSTPPQSPPLTQQPPSPGEGESQSNIDATSTTITTTTTTTNTKPMKEPLDLGVSDFETEEPIISTPTTLMENGEELPTESTYTINTKATDTTTVTTSKTSSSAKGPFINQAMLLPWVGEQLGKELRRLLQERLQPEPETFLSRFQCPLDEALVLCELTYRNDLPSTATARGELLRYTLPPYGQYPPLSGRKYIGTMETEHLVRFWTALAEFSGLTIVLDKIRGRNAHHIVEASFKAFSRAFRNLLDGVSTTESTALHQWYGPDSYNARLSVELHRTADHERKTKETAIRIHMALDGGTEGVSIDTGLHTLNRFFQTLAYHAAMSLTIQCQGDLWIDEHHTAEDVSIAVGQVLNTALGTKAGLNRMWSTQANSGSAIVDVVVDLSNRPCFTHNFETDQEFAGDLPFEMVEHVLDSFVINARLTVHVVVQQAGDTTLETIDAVAVAMGQALKYCAMVDSRRAGGTASSKGTLSV